MASEGIRNENEASYDAYLINKYAGDDYIRSEQITTWPYTLIENIYCVSCNNTVEFDLDGLNEAIVKI